MTKLITPSLYGLPVGTVYTPPEESSVRSPIPTPALGTVAKGDDGHDYILAVAGATFSAADAAGALNESGFVMAQSAGQWASTSAMAEDDIGWFRKAVIDDDGD